MKAITVLEPWASLIACGAKKVETRSWETSYRGKLAIHAAKSTKCLDVADEDSFRYALKENKGIMQDQETGLFFSPGCVIAIADLVACVEINESHIYYLKKDQKDGRCDEIDFGDYTLGHYAWILRNVQRIEPISAKGQQRIWNLNVPAMELASWHSEFQGGTGERVDTNSLEKLTGQKWGRE